ncbi:MAG TPA: hypothetical protein VLF20_02280 [Patescibacteria group bacterium]|nr:hypothetical protein [Patescibacteria group bacterium]
MHSIIIKQLEKRKQPIDVIVSGLGFMSFGFISAMQQTKGIRVPLVLTRRVDDATTFLTKKGFKVKKENSPKKIKEAADKGYICVSDDLDLIATYDNSIVFEMTGTVVHGAEIGIKAIEAGKHLITMNPELQVTVGSELKKLADKKNVLITDVVGDQPGSLARLIASSQLKGFEVLMAGNMKRFMNRYATQKEMKPWADDKGLAVRQTVSFTDGTKQSIEMNLVANYLGMNITKRGMTGIQIQDIKEIVNHFDWEKLPKEGIVDFAIDLKMFPGIFIVAKHKDPHQQQYLRYLGLGDGPYYVLFEPYHLCHLEVIETIANVALFGEVTINNSTTPITKTITLAKRDLQAGEMLDGIGGDTVYGEIDLAKNSKELLPVGFAHNAKLIRNVAKDEPIAIRDVILPINEATKLAGLVKDEKVVSTHKQPIAVQFFNKVFRS